MTTICLCGSTRFEQQFKDANYELSKRGFVVLSLSSGPSDRPVGEALDPVDKLVFDLTYFEKIRMADAVLVLDSTGMSTFPDQPDPHRYLGFSTAREILWAQLQGRPCFSFSTATGWGNLHELVEHRYDEHYLKDHTWLYAHARQVLRDHAGREVVADQMGSAHLTNLHAGLSVIVSQSADPAAAALAERVLEANGLDPLSDVSLSFAAMGLEQYLGPIPTAAQAASPAKEMATLERRKLLGTVIMVQACMDMLTQRPKLSRREVGAKLQLLSDTLLSGSGLHQSDVDYARETNEGLDFPVAEHHPV